MVHTIKQLPKQPLVNDYIKGKPEATAFFEYALNDSNNDQKRLMYINSHDYQRHALYQVLYRYNQSFTNESAVFNNIEKIKDNRSVTVIGGQQAGLLTGPAYTIHKCLTIIKLAKEKEKKLGVPVIPVFWIAGEDHDFDEINHVFTGRDHQLEKITYEHIHNNKQPVSTLTFEQEKMTQWIEHVFNHYGESEYTRELVRSIERDAAQSRTYVDFFARLIHRLFGHHGLVLVDACSYDVRQLESSYFLRLMQQAEPLNQSIIKQLDNINKHGYTVNLELSEQSANLFYHKDGERKLLERNEIAFFAKDHTVKLGLDEASEIAMHHPERFSNNVVSRPLMQELLFPTLAFVAGPGEIAYWSALKPAFREMGLEMPPVIPRIRLTLVERSLSKWLTEKNLSIEDAFKQGLGRLKKQWLDHQETQDVQKVVDDVKVSLKEAYQPLAQLATDVDSSLETVVDKNHSFIENQVEFMQNQIRRTLKIRHQTELLKFDKAQLALTPHNQPQERIWTIYYFINHYGLDVVERLLEENYSFKGEHHIFYI